MDLTPNNAKDQLDMLNILRAETRRYREALLSAEAVLNVTLCSATRDRLGRVPFHLLQRWISHMGGSR